MFAKKQMRALDAALDAFCAYADNPDDTELDRRFLEAHNAWLDVKGEEDVLGCDLPGVGEGTKRSGKRSKRVAAMPSVQRKRLFDM